MTSENRNKSPLRENKETIFISRARTPDISYINSQSVQNNAKTDRPPTSFRPLEEKKSKSYHGRKFKVLNSNRSDSADLNNKVAYKTYTEPNRLDTSEDDIPKPRINFPTPFSQEKLKEYQTNLMKGKSSKKLNEIRDSFLENNINDIVADLKLHFQHIKNNPEQNKLKRKFVKHSDRYDKNPNEGDVNGIQKNHIFTKDNQPKFTPRTKVRLKNSIEDINLKINKNTIEDSIDRFVFAAEIINSLLESLFT